MKKLPVISIAIAILLASTGYALADGIAQPAQPVTVAQGGTGDTSLGSNTVLIGQGTSPVATVAVGSSGQCLTGSAGAPAFAPCGGGASVAYIAPTAGPTIQVTPANTPAASNTPVPSTGTTLASVTIASGTHSVLLIGFATAHAAVTTGGNCETTLYDSTTNTYLSSSAADVGASSVANRDVTITESYVGSFSSSDVIQLKGWCILSGVQWGLGGANATNIVAVQLS